MAKDPEFAGRSLLHPIAGFVTRLLGWSKPETEYSLMRHAVEAFERKLSVKRAGATYIVDIGFEATDPDRAARILNTLAQTYISAPIDARYQFASPDQMWTKDRLAELSSKATAAQKILDDYRNAKRDDPDSVDAGAERALIAAADSSKAAYDSFRHVARQTEAVRQQSAPMFEASLVTRASPPLRASSPRAGIVLGMSMIGGTLLGIGLGMLRDLLDRGIQTSGQVWKELQIACIAVIPRVRSSDAKRAVLFANSTDRQNSTDRHERALSNSNSRSVERRESPIWPVMDAPQSRFSESLLEIKLAIDSMYRNGKRSQIIGITSTFPHEGKSTIAASLALLIAQTGAKAILLDCNFRHPSLSTLLAPAAEVGVLDVVSGAASLRGTTWIEPTTQLAFLPIGNTSRSTYRSGVPLSELLNKLSHTLRAAYEYVIVDLPPMAPCADVPTAMSALDSSIFVVEASRTNVDVVKRALEIIRYENVLGIVLNHAGNSSVWTHLVPKATA
ncbi:P-loop NTPase [Bradyrhizobium sp. PMVTL-01]|uniref:P-loop NTPase n=1 Tax=Bradyrhizobium sp. PMVTL-01 TaxID=3434999 RepID=UPI003F70B838